MDILEELRKTVAALPPGPARARLDQRLDALALERAEAREALSAAIKPRAIPRAR